MQLRNKPVRKTGDSCNNNHESWQSKYRAARVFCNNYNVAFRTKMFWQGNILVNVKNLVFYCPIIVHVFTVIIHDVSTSIVFHQAPTIFMKSMILTVFKSSDQIQLISSRKGDVMNRWKREKSRETQGCTEGERKQSFHRLSNCRFIPEGN